MEIYFFENLLKCVGSSIVLSSLVSCLFSFEPVFKFNSGVIIIPFLVGKDLFSKFSSNKFEYALSGEFLIPDVPDFLSEKI